MSVITATVARTNLYKLIDKTKESHEPILISGKRNNAVLISEEDWKSIQETLFLCSIPLHFLLMVLCLLQELIHAFQELSINKVFLE